MQVRICEQIYFMICKGLTGCGLSTKIELTILFLPNPLRYTASESIHPSEHGKALHEEVSN